MVQGHKREQWINPIVYNGQINPVHFLNWPPISNRSAAERIDPDPNPR